MLYMKKFSIEYLELLFLVFKSFKVEFIAVI